MESVRVIVTGTRHPSFKLESIMLPQLEQALSWAQEVGRELTIVHGAARGADTVAAFWTLAAGVEHEAHPADWAQHGYGAGPIRNAQMVACGADLVLAFPEVRSVGTWDCVRKATWAGIPVRIFPVIGD